ncbi:hypothetical protein BDZ89DRAFT_1112318 [Hymenopellis radicata]|nr:hypothetical protein BDZ89DRAFT_1112318 [Hymenopellis radicata]
MSRRAAVVEEFDDDTDLPLPSQPLPNFGNSGPLLQEIADSDDDDFEPPSQRAGPASPPRPSSSDVPPELKNSVTDITPYKKSVMDVHLPHIHRCQAPVRHRRATGRPPKSVWWPLSKDIAEATNRLGLGTLHEVNKSHPRDWENPGRVRVQWKKDGRLINPAIQTKKQLLEMICLQIQRLKPENVPKAPFNTTPSNTTEQQQQQHPPSKSSATKGKQPATTKSKSPQPTTKRGGRRPPIPPEPHPPLASRVSQYSPAISTGVLIETVKAGMNAQEATPPPALLLGHRARPRVRRRESERLYESEDS